MTPMTSSSPAPLSRPPLETPPSWSQSPPLTSRPRKCGVDDVWMVWISSGETANTFFWALSLVAWSSLSFAAKPFRL